MGRWGGGAEERRGGGEEGRRGGMGGGTSGSTGAISMPSSSTLTELAWVELSDGTMPSGCVSVTLM